MKVRLTTSMVSLRGQSQAASMWALPVRSMVACERTGWSVVRMSCDLRREASKADWSPASRRFQVDGGDGFFYFGEEVFARGGECGQDVGGGDALDADVFGVGAGWLGGIGFDLEVDAGEGLFVDGVEELDGDEDLVAGLGGVEEDDGFEVVAERYAAAVEVDDLGHGAVGVGVELEPDAGAGEVVAVEGLGDGEGLAVPDGVVRGFAARGDGLPGTFVELDGFAVGEIAGVHLPRAVGQIGDGGKTRDDCLRFRLEIGGDFGSLFGGLGLRAGGEEGENSNGDKASKGSAQRQTARPEFRYDGHGVLAPRSILRHADAEMVTIPRFGNEVELSTRRSRGAAWRSFIPSRRR